MTTSILIGLGIFLVLYIGFLFLKRSVKIAFTVAKLGAVLVVAIILVGGFFYLRSQGYF